MRVIREIAQGGFGFVSEVELADGMRVARKCFDPAYASIAILGLDALKARFKREVKIQRQLSGNFFIPVLSSDLDNDPPSFTMPLAAKNYTGVARTCTAALRLQGHALQPCGCSSLCLATTGAVGSASRSGTSRPGTVDTASSSAGAAIEHFKFPLRSEQHLFNAMLQPAMIQLGLRIAILAGPWIGRGGRRPLSAKEFLP
jgi:hypothetical protein